MFDIDKWQEIFSTIQKNRLRTFLTGFSVAWGIFILIVLLGSGQGLKNGAEHQFLSDASNAIWLQGDVTSMPYKGMQAGRRIRLKNEDFEYIKKNIEGVEYITVAQDVPNVKSINYKNEKGNYLVRSCQTDHDKLEKCNMISGRFLNDMDIKEARKVAVIGKPVQDALFKEEDPIGKYVDVSGILYKVIGVFKDEGRQDNDRLYIPISTMQKSYNGKDYVDVIWFSTGNASLLQSKRMLEDSKAYIYSKYKIDPTDERAFVAFDNNENYKQIMDLLNGIKFFVGIIGVGTIIAGIVGVSNIMMIVVKERTKEIGVRKAIGATPYSIVSLVIQESILITGFAGYVGLVLGVVVTELAKKFMPPSDFFRNPEVDLSVAVGATLFLIFAGAVAGFVPALKAARIKPIEALRDE
jgi:putative ABC transport system permease protein